MSTSPQPVSRYTRLRDFGAFQPDVSAVNTHELQVPVVTPLDGQLPVTPQFMSVRMGPAITPVEMLVSRQSSGSHMSRDGTITVTPFPPAQPLLRLPARPAKQGSALSMSNRQAGGLKPGVRVRKWLAFCLRILLTLALFAFLLRTLSWHELLLAFAQARRSLALMGLAIGTLGVILSAYQWRYLLRGEHILIDLADLVNLYTVGIAFSHFLPTGMGGDAVKALYTGRESGNSEGAVSAVVMSRLTGFFGMLLIALGALLVWHQTFAPQMVLWFALLCVLVGLLLLAGLIGALLLPRLLGSRRAGTHPLSFVTRAGDVLSRAFRHPRQLAIASLFGAVFWIVACLNAYCYACALGLPVPFSFYLVAVPLISLVAFLPISINGFGLRESTMVYIFALVHVPAASALLLALLLDLQGVLFGLIGGGLYLAHGRSGRGGKG
jgi:uncharacterized membrane protein YbhN (UPF0104 family)